MSIELWACILLAFASIPVAREFTIHYLAFIALNISFLGYEYADSTVLAMSFCVVAVVDCILAIVFRRASLAFCSFVSAALCIEQIIGLDYLLTNAFHLSLITNAFIVTALAKEYARWISGKRQFY